MTWPFCYIINLETAFRNLLILALHIIHPLFLKFCVLELFVRFRCSHSWISLAAAAAAWAALIKVSSSLTLDYSSLSSASAACLADVPARLIFPPVTPNPPIDRPAGEWRERGEVSLVLVPSSFCVSQTDSSSQAIWADRRRRRRRRRRE